MLLFLLGILLLIVGYFTYGTFVNRILSPDANRTTPAIGSADGVDFVALPTWRNIMIQLLNIAGVGPVMGVIGGILFGKIVFLIIPIGCIIAGATHDFMLGMISLRDNGANLPKIIRDNLGGTFSHFATCFISLMLLLVVAVFINVPAHLVENLVGAPCFWWAVVAVFAYYILATLFPVDKIIGTIYPYFGLLLIIGTAAIFVKLLIDGFVDPSLLSESEAFRAGKNTVENNKPIIPLLFLTIACGIISGFHGTQAPIVARTIKNEREAKSTFYGTMVAEGVIAMVWGGAALVTYNRFPDFMTKSWIDTLALITGSMLGNYLGAITVIAVVILAITSGDTALRSMRLSIAEVFNIDQKPLKKRIITCIPLIIAVIFVLFWANRDAKSFAHLWNYFAWANQVISAISLFAATVWLRRHGKLYFIALIPAAFMTFIVLSFIIWTSPKTGGQYGLGLPLNVALAIAGVLTLALSSYILTTSRRR